MQDINSMKIPLSIWPIVVGATTLSKMTPNIITLIKTTISVIVNTTVCRNSAHYTACHYVKCRYANVIVLCVNMLSAEYYYAV
jgi:hypothetical protein